MSNFKIFFLLCALLSVACATEQEDNESLQKKSIIEEEKIQNRKQKSNSNSLRDGKGRLNQSSSSNKRTSNDRIIKRISRDKLRLETNYKIRQRLSSTERILNSPVSPKFFLPIDVLSESPNSKTESFIFTSQCNTPSDDSPVVTPNLVDSSSTSIIKTDKNREDKGISDLIQKKLDYLKQPNYLIFPSDKDDDEKYEPQEEIKLFNDRKLILDELILNSNITDFMDDEIVKKAKFEKIKLVN